MKKIILIGTLLSLSLILSFFMVSNIKVDTVNDEVKATRDFEIKKRFDVLDDNSIDLDDVESYDVVILVKMNIESRDFSITNIDMFETMTSEEIDEYLLNHREMVKNYYLEKNNEIISTLNIEDYSYSVSYYASFFEIKLDSVIEFYSNEEILTQKLASNPKIEYAVAKISAVDMTNVNSSSYSEEYDLEDAFNDIKVTNSLYSGNGVNIGTIERGTPYDTENLKEDKYTHIDGIYTEHCKVVTSIIGGKTGISKDAHLYSIGSLNIEFTICLNKLISRGHVNVINMSAGFDEITSYDEYCCYLDEFVRNTCCSFVTSAGNNANNIENNYIASPAMALNVITVGSIDKNKNMSCFSSWKMEDFFVGKPDLVAPGGNISNIPNIEGSKSGTSFSAPMVTGVIGLLMEEFPILKINPALLKATLIGGCSDLPSQTQIYDKKSGFGLVNYDETRSILLRKNYRNFSILTTDECQDVVDSMYINLKPYEEITFYITWIPHVEMYEENSFDDPQFSSCNMYLYGLTSTDYICSYETIENVLYLVFKNDTSEKTTYRLNVMLNTSNEREFDELGTIAYVLYSEHEFNYSYVYKDSLGHTSYCECGESIYEKHDFYYSKTGYFCRYCGYYTKGPVLLTIKNPDNDYFTLCEGEF